MNRKRVEGFKERGRRKEKERERDKRQERIEGYLGRE